ncbi:MAG: glycosyltransferase [archaeon]
MPPSRPRVEIHLPLYESHVNEALQNVPIVHAFCSRKLSTYHWRIVIDFNGPDKGGLSKIIELAKRHPHICVTQIGRAGKGAAVLNAAITSIADYFVYMDVDLSTDLEALPLLLETAPQGDVVTGSRYLPSSIIHRDPVRFFASKTFTLLLRPVLGARFTDPECGFKSMNVHTMRDIFLRVQDSQFFFETEMMYLAQKNGKKIVEIPVRWTERGNSSLKLIPTITSFLKNLHRIRFTHSSIEAPWREKVNVVHDSHYT